MFLHKQRTLSAVIFLFFPLVLSLLCVCYIRLYSHVVHKCLCRSTQRNRSTKYPLHRSMFFWLFNWLVIFLCFYEILLGDQLQNKFAWDFNYFLCCWLETANQLRSGWRLIAEIFPYRKLPTFLLVCLPERFYAMFIAFHVAVVLFL